EMQSLAQIGNHLVERDRQLAELTAAMEIGPGVQVSIADALHEADKGLDRGGNAPSKRCGQQSGDTERQCGGTEGQPARTPYGSEKIGLRCDGADDPGLSFVDWKDCGGGQIVDAVVAESKGVKFFSRGSA